MRQCYILLLILFCIHPLSWAHGGDRNIEFIENRGQWEGGFLYKAQLPGCDIFLEQGGFTFLLSAPENTIKVNEYRHGQRPGPVLLNFHAYKVFFEGARLQPTVTATKKQKHYYNYFLGAKAENWKSGIHPFLNVDYRELYDGIDMHIASESGRLKYDFILQPGADPSLIRLRYDGTEKMSVKGNKLVIETSVGTVTEQEPYAFQIIDGVRKQVRCQYRLRGKVLSYVFPDGYDETQLLVIDPTVVFSTFTGSTADNFGFTATYDAAGNFYAGGFAHSTGYPTTTGAFQRSFAGGSVTVGNGYACDMAITKFDATGANLLYSTYLGGSSNDQPHSMVVDHNNNLVVVGRTHSADFPVQNAFDNSYNGTTDADIVVTKFNNAGTALIGSTFMGGSADDGVNISANPSVKNTTLKKNFGDDARSEVIVDNAGNVYVAAATSSQNFPVVSGTGHKGGQDGVVFKLNSNLSALLWSTYLGGSNLDAAYVLALDNDQSHLFVAGGTISDGISVGTVYQNGRQGDVDGYIARFLNNGAFPLERLSYIGTSSYDQTYGLQIDVDNNVYAMGQTNGNFPVIAAAYSNAGANQFIIKLDYNLSGPIFSTVFGSTNASEPNISPVAFLVDTCQNIYVSGWGGGGTTLIGHSGNTNNMPVLLGTGPSPAPLSANTDGADFYFIALARNLTSLLFAGYFGSNNANHGEHVDGGTSRFDKNGVIYQAICGGCGGNSLPTTPGSWSTTNGSGNCNLAALKIEFNLGAVDARAAASPDATLCLGETVQFQNSSSNAVSFEWDFGDGSGVNTQQNPQHTYNKVGVFPVRMIAVNPDACKVRDTVYLQIRVDTNLIDAAFDIVDVQNCPPYSARFVNTSQFGNTPGSGTFTKFIWDFGDGSSFTGQSPAPHVYADSGIYTVRLVMIDSTACNSPDTLVKTLHLSSDSVKADFDLPPVICTQNDVLFRNTSIKGVKYIWNFGDGDTSSLPNPAHRYDTVGTYTVSLIAINEGSCNKIDSVSKSFTVKEAPTADFVYEPIMPETNVPTTFTNHSSGAIGYLWNFGDNTGSDEHTPRPHQYKRTGEYTVCLSVWNLEGCADTICKVVPTDVYPLADIPTGFSPNGDGNNDILYVVGAGIETMNLRIFNRWGELVFESNDQAIGWDGTHKGKQQEMDAYAYTLNITFIDETTLHKQGNITLIR